MNKWKIKLWTWRQRLLMWLSSVYFRIKYTRCAIKGGHDIENLSLAPEMYKCKRCGIIGEVPANLCTTCYSDFTRHHISSKISPCIDPTCPYCDPALLVAIQIPKNKFNLGDSVIVFQTLADLSIRLAHPAVITSVSYCLSPDPISDSLDVPHWFYDVEIKLVYGFKEFETIVEENIYSFSPMLILTNIMEYWRMAAHTQFTQVCGLGEYLEGNLKEYTRALLSSTRELTDKNELLDKIAVEFESLFKT